MKEGLIFDRITYLTEPVQYYTQHLHGCTSVKDLIDFLSNWHNYRKQRAKA